MGERKKEKKKKKALVYECQPQKVDMVHHLIGSWRPRLGNLISYACVIFFCMIMLWHRCPSPTAF